MGDKSFYDVMLHPVRYSSKKHAVQHTGMIKNTILQHPVSLTIEEIAEACVNGHAISFCHAENTGNKKSFTSECWKYQQLYALDFDNTEDGVKYLAPYYMEYQKAIQHAQEQGFSPAFVYTTDSHSETCHRYRIVFVLDEPVDSILQHRQVLKALCNIFQIKDKIIVDKKCIDPARVFYAGQDLVYKSYGSTVSKNKLLNKGKIVCPPKPALKQQQKAGSSSASVVRNVEAVQQIIDEVKSIQKKSSNFRNTLLTQQYQGFEGGRAKGRTDIYNLLISVLPKGKTPGTPVMMRSPEDFYNLSYQIDLSELLNVPYEEKFSCILPDHEDTTPSAIIQMHDGVMMYNCYGCGAHYNIYGLIQKLTGCSHYTVKEWIAQRFNICYETEWQHQKKQEILFYQDYLMSEDFAKNYEVLNKFLLRRNLKGVLNMMLHLSRMYIVDKDSTGSNHVLFYMGLRWLALKSKDFGIMKSKNTIDKNIKLLANLGLIEVLSDSELPVKTRILLEKRKEASEKRYRINCYGIPTLTVDLLQRALKTILEDKEKNLRTKYLCKDTFLRANKENTAKDLYVQSSQKRSKKLDDFFEKYKSVTLKLIAKKGWTTEQEILGKMRSYSKMTRISYSQICLPQLLEELSLKRIPYSKEIESRYAVKSSKKLYYGATRVIVAE